MVGENFQIYDVQITENAFASQISTMSPTKLSPSLLLSTHRQKEITQPAFTCSKLTIKTPEHCYIGLRECHLYLR